MDDRGISINDMAEALDLSEKTVSAYYRGSKKIGRKTLTNIIKILDLDEEDIDDSH